MFCRKCGAENADGNKFCNKCGQPLSGETNGVPKMAPGSQINVNSEKVKEEATKVVNKVKSLPKKTLGMICGGAVLLIVVLAIMINNANTINLDKYLTLKSDGFDGYGKVKVSIDWDAIDEKYGSKLKFTGAAKKELDDKYLDRYDAIDLVRSAVSVSIDDNYSLSNGDEVSYKWNIEDELSEYVNCKLKYKDGKYKVSELKEIGSFDAFKDLTVEFSGTAPNGYANLNYVGSELSYYDFDCDKTSGLSNGDTITVTIDSSKIEYCAKNYGKVPESTEKTYTVANLESYLSKLNELNKDSLAKMQAQAEDVFNADVANNWGDDEVLESLTYIGDYLLTSKNGNGNNKLYLVYKAQVHDTYSNDEATYDKINDVYWYICFRDIKIGADGKAIVDLTYYDTPYDRVTIDTGLSAGWWSNKGWYYYGYSTLDELYKNAVSKNVDSYNHEDSVDESLAPKTVDTGDGITLNESDAADESESADETEAESTGA
ncbi:zinc ribbon domain-containing protein [Oribacterium sp. FC2011]|uniref:zinc ribbon domain-containing protein n=1 Tax=Oribacterium sp. FC2011 TaxID=1408311 RepID=UPI0004E2273A|nr:zinc ribbon domain-containing protein [Oribacterium sp. FC2011]